MEQLVSEIVTALMFAGLLVTMFFGYKYWIDKGGIDKLEKKINYDIAEQNKKLKKEVKIQKQLIKSYQALHQMQEREISELLVEDEKTEIVESLEENADEK